METLFILGIVALIAFYAGWKTREIHAMRAMNDIVEEFTENTVNEFKKNVVNINVEYHDGQFFVYNKEDGSYLAHGENKTKLEDILIEKFPGKLFNASPEDLEKLESR